MGPIHERRVGLARGLGGFMVLGLVLGLAAPVARAAMVTQITSFGSNPTGIGMYLYTPAKVVAKPPILVGIHACHGKGLDVCTSGNPFAQQADKYGFLLICPSAVSSDGCWDVHSMADLTHGGGGDAQGILSMVSYVVANKNGDASRVYAAGHSSGAMMTNVLLGSYPDVFKAGAAFAGVPFACFAQGSIDSLGWSSTCANGNVTMTGAEWGALVRAAYPGFTGTRPRIQLWHGTVDATLSFHNFGEEIKEWTNVLGVSATPTSTEENAIEATWIRTRYADSGGVVQVEAIQETGQPHNLVIDGAEAIHFLGLDGSNPVPDGGTVAPSDAGVAGGGGAASGGNGGVGGGGGKGAAGTSGTGGATAAGGTTGGNPSGGSSGGGGTLAGGSGGSGAGGAGGSSSGAGTGAIGGSSSGAGTGGVAAGGSSGGSSGGASGGSSDGSSGGSSGPSNGGAGRTGTTSSSAGSSGCSLGGHDDRIPPPGLWVCLGALLVHRRRRGAR